MDIKSSHLVLLFVLCGFCAVHGQILGPGLKSQKFEIGYIYRWFHRRTQDPAYEPDWASEAIFMKYGITDWLTISAEGLVFKNMGSGFPDRDYREYNIGAGTALQILKVEFLQIGFSFHYYESFSFDRSEDTYHKRTNGFMGAIPVEYPFSLLNQNIILWIAPIYVYDEILNYSYGSYDPIVSKSQNNWGGVVGINCLLFRHFEPFFHLVYADFFQPRVGIGYQF